MTKPDDKGGESLYGGDVRRVKEVSLMTVLSSTPFTGRARHHA